MRRLDPVISLAIRRSRSAGCAAEWNTRRARRARRASLPIYHAKYAEVAEPEGKDFTPDFVAQCKSRAEAGERHAEHGRDASTMRPISRTGGTPVFPDGPAGGRSLVAIYRTRH